MKNRKQVFAILGTFIFLLANLSCSHAQKFEQTLKKSATFSDNGKQKVLVIDNINGYIKVEAHSSNTVELEADQRITSDSQSGLEQGKKEVKIAMEEHGDTIVIYIDCPYITRKRNGKNSWWNWNHDNEPDYYFKHDFRVKAPANINLSACTVNKGFVKIKGIHANELRAQNVNGDVFLEDVTGKTRAGTVNGSVEVSYKDNPPMDSKYSTVNGDITIHYRKDLSANLEFKSMHGEFFTDFDVSGYLPTKVSKEQGKSGNIRFVVNKYTGVKVGKGDKSYKFETLNGDIYVKKL